MSSSCRHTKSAKNFESAEVHPQAAPQERRLRLHKGRDVCPLAGKFQPTRHCSSSPQLNSHRRSGARAGHDCSFTALCEKLTNRPAHTHAHPARSDTLTTDTDPQTSSYRARPSRHLKRGDCSHGRSAMVRIVRTVDGCCCAVVF